MAHVKNLNPFLQLSATSTEADVESTELEIERYSVILKIYIGLKMYDILKYRLYMFRFSRKFFVVCNAFLYFY